MKFQRIYEKKNIVILPLLVNRFEKYFDRLIQNYPNKLKIVKGNRFDI